MTMIPDPIVLMESRIERMIAEQDGVPDGSFRCPGCDRVLDYEPISTSGAPDAPISCYDCLSPDMQAAWDRFDS